MLCHVLILDLDSFHLRIQRSDIDHQFSVLRYVSLPRTKAFVMKKGGCPSYREEIQSRRHMLILSSSIGSRLQTLHPNCKTLALKLYTVAANWKDRATNVKPYLKYR